MENKLLLGLLNHLLAPNQPWDVVTMDFISALPKSEGIGLIIVVIDQLSKHVNFIPTPKDYTAEETIRLFFKHTETYEGLPKHIVSDWHLRFTGKLWMDLFKLLGLDLQFSSSFQPTDQTKRVNSLLECYLRHYASANQRDWAMLMDTTQFSYNIQKSECTGHSPFEFVTE